MNRARDILQRFGAAYRRTRPPGPGIESLRRRGRTTLEFLAAMREYGDMTWFPIGMDGCESFVIFRPDLVEDVLVTHRHAFIKGRGLQRMRTLLGDGLLTSEGETWKRHRQLLAPKFHRRAVTGYAEEFARTSAEYLDAVAPNAAFDVHPWFMRMTLDITLRALFGRGLGAETERIGDALAEVLDWFAITTPRLLFIPPRVPTPLNRRLLANCEILRSSVASIIDARRRSCLEQDDLLGMLIAARDEEGGRLSEQELVDEVLTILLAGHETTAQALTFTIDLLSRHPDARDRAIDEVAALPVDGLADPAMLRELTWVDACMRESMRLWPPAPMTAREAIEDVEIGGWTIPKGGQAVIPILSLHRDPSLWEDPMAFAPQRWLGDPEIARFAYLPFGGGHRICIGDAFARLEIVAVLAQLLRRFRPVATTPEPPGVIASVTIRPDRPVVVRMRPVIEGGA